MFKRESEFSVKVCNPSHQTPSKIADPGKVRLGGIGPSFGSVQVAPAQIRDGGKVRLGGIGPSLGPVKATPVQIRDGGKVRLGEIGSAI
jgi:hypothetical protein